MPGKHPLQRTSSIESLLFQIYTQKHEAENTIESTAKARALLEKKLKVLGGRLSTKKISTKDLMIDMRKNAQHDKEYNEARKARGVLTPKQIKLKKKLRRIRRSR
eukprot:GHVN01095789.1.p1 GENE.GHVN01095789.1~~GHVN01095789.1.p1  ORF type:complete len:105 (-),score=12.96 GHVN01095789.1:213-527(-)